MRRHEQSGVARDAKLLVRRLIAGLRGRLVLISPLTRSIMTRSLPPATVSIKTTQRGSARRRARHSRGPPIPRQGRSPAKREALPGIPNPQIALPSKVADVHDKGGIRRGGRVLSSAGVDRSARSRCCWGRWRSPIRLQTSSETTGSGETEHLVVKQRSGARAAFVRRRSRA